jgi:hypothetical protein
MRAHKHKYQLSQQDFRSYPSVKHYYICSLCGDKKEEWIGQTPKYKCVYCNLPLPYEGACKKCGRKEDEALGKI